MHVFHKRVFVVFAAVLCGVCASSARAATPESDALAQAKAAIKQRLAEVKADQAQTSATLFEDLAILQGNIVGGAVLTPDIPNNVVGAVVPGMVQLYRDARDGVNQATIDIEGIYFAASLEVPPAMQAGSSGDVDKMRVKLDAGNAKLFKKIASSVKKLADATNKALSAGYRFNATVLPFPPLPPVLAARSESAVFTSSETRVFILAAGSTGVAASGRASAGGLLDEFGTMVVNLDSSPSLVGGNSGHTWQVDESGIAPDTVAELGITDGSDSVFIEKGGIYIPAP